MLNGYGEWQRTSPKEMLQRIEACQVSSLPRAVGRGWMGGRGREGGRGGEGRGGEGRGGEGRGGEGRGGREGQNVIFLIQDRVSGLIKIFG